MLTWVYFCVVERLACPSSSWMTRDVRAAGEEVGRERVAERVRAHLPLQRELEHRAVQVPGNAP